MVKTLSTNLIFPLMKTITFIIFIGLFFDSQCTYSQKTIDTVSTSAWSSNSINTVIFRKNALYTFKDTQFIAYYNSNGYLELGKRFIHSKQWTLATTPFKGHVTDAHNSISIIVDGEGYLHVSWDHHGHSLHYARSKAPFSLGLELLNTMDGVLEKTVTYPEFYSLPKGDLLFLYRDGFSGNGSVVLKRYLLKEKRWTTVHQNLIDGEGKRSAYWQANVDRFGGVHLSWVWRESADVSSNHDLCYAYSPDGGFNWQHSKGQPYKIPINEQTAELLVHIPEKSELINQTSLFALSKQAVFIAGYWKGEKDSVPQYQLVTNVSGVWKTISGTFRKTDFSLSGVGTKQIPISRPQVVAISRNDRYHVWIIFRDQAYGNRPMAAFVNLKDPKHWKLQSLAHLDLGYWEPCLDPALWSEKGVLSLFLQHTEQADNEGIKLVAETSVGVLSVKLR